MRAAWALYVIILVLIFTGLSSVHAANADGKNKKSTPVEVVGTVLAVSADDFTNNRHEHFYLIDGTATTTGTLRPKSKNGRFSLAFDGEPPADLTHGDIVKITGHLLKSTVHVGASADVGVAGSDGANGRHNTNVETISVSAAARAASGTQNTLVIIANFTDSSTSASSASLTPEMFSPPPATSSINAYYQDNSFGLVNFAGQVVGPYTINYTSTSADYYGWASAADAKASAAGVNLNNYSHKVYIVPQSSDPSMAGWAGLGTIGGSPSQAWIFGPYWAYVKVIAHELGHNLGTHHASNFDGSSEYGDNSDTMGGWGGYGDQMPQMNAARKIEFGWVPSSRVVTATANGSYTISQLETAGSSAQCLKVHKSDTNEDWYVGYRVPVGFDSTNLPPGYYGTQVHRAPGYSGQHTYYYQNLTDTQSFADGANGITITQTSHDASTATLSVSFTPVPKAPTVTISPSSQTGTSGQVLTYTVTVKDNDSVGSANTTFTLSPAVPSGFTATTAPTTLTLAAGASGTSTFTVASSSTSGGGNYAVSVNVGDSVNAVHNASGSATYVVNNNPPAAPTNLKASVRPGKVTLTWGASSGATSYNVSRNGVTIASVTGTSYVNTSVTKGTAYTYQVFAVNNVGTSAGSNTVKVTAK
jgi:M6 family metalloprotease-like protein